MAGHAYPHIVFARDAQALPREALQELLTGLFADADPAAVVEQAPLKVALHLGGYTFSFWYDDDAEGLGERYADFAPPLKRRRIMRCTTMIDVSGPDDPQGAHADAAHAITAALADHEGVYVFAEETTSFLGMSEADDPFTQAPVPAPVEPAPAAAPAPSPQPVEPAPAPAPSPQPVEPAPAPEPPAPAPTPSPQPVGTPHPPVEPPRPGPVTPAPSPLAPAAHTPPEEPAVEPSTATTPTPAERPELAPPAMPVTPEPAPAPPRPQPAPPAQPAAPPPPAAEEPKKGRFKRFFTRTKD